MKKLHFEVAGFSAAGAGKIINQDAFLYRVSDAGQYETALLAVADGVSGLSSGDKAAGVSIAHLARWWETEFRKSYGSRDEIALSLFSCFRKSNQVLLQWGEKLGQKMATTLSVLLFYENKYMLVHVGDSRIYHVKNGRSNSLRQLTEDHSVLVSAKNDPRAPGKKLLTECIGYRSNFGFSCTAGPLEHKDVFLCCSDGIYKRLSTKDIAKTIVSSPKNLAVACTNLVEEARRNGETDDVTAVLARVDGSYTPRIR